MNNIYIALDLETTGFDSEKDQVLEIAAIKFQGNQILEKFETLINPEVEIPAMVSHITGINQETVKDAPTFDQISKNLRNFLGNFPIVGHNIDFDLTFLEAKGIPLLNKQYDTFHLGSILLPNLPSYSLETISRELKINHQNKHRAMSDAHVCFELFQILTDKISEIPAATLEQIKHQVLKTSWDLGDLFIQAKSKVKRTLSAEIAGNIPDLNLNIDSPEDLVDLLNSPSPLEQIVSKYEARPAQKLMLEKILDAFKHKYSLLAEAGTGTGKTFAYLLAAAFQNRKHQSKVVISTNTNNLQDQILKKDFLVIKSIFPEIQITTLKGHRKYLSLSRFEKLKSKDQLEEHELTTIIKTLIWLDKTVTGDLDELNLQNKETVLFEEICSNPEITLKQKKYQQQDFLEKAREKAQSADIIVINHALLINDTVSETPILPEYQYLIVDEAHHLERTTTDALTEVLGQNKLTRLLEAFSSECEDIWKGSLIFDGQMAELIPKLNGLKSKITEINEKAFYLVRDFLLQTGKASPSIPCYFNLIRSITDSSVWQKIREYFKDLSDQKAGFEQLGNQLISVVLQNQIEETELPVKLKKILQIFEQTTSLAEIKADRIYWISKGLDEYISLHSAPLTINKITTEKLFKNKQSVILTSATLTTYGNFRFIKNELGLDENFEELKLASHFNYPDQVKIIIPENLPEPKDPQYLSHCNKVIKSVIEANKGKTLTLFTAKKDLSKTFHEIAASLKEKGINLLGQGISGGRGKIISNFESEPSKTAILGTNSFWEGVDLAGDILTCVIIQKLPFDPPDDPIIYARSQLFDRPFEEYALPRAILRFKQGFGRLIRTSSDTGAVIILDSRLLTKTYGRQFIISLPGGINIIQCENEAVAECL